MQTYETLLADATQLPVTDRIQLIDAIWATLPVEALPALSDEWTAEIRRRSAEYDSGSIETVPWERIKAKALGRAGLTVDDASN